MSWMPLAAAGINALGSALKRGNDAPANASTGPLVLTQDASGFVVNFGSGSVTSERTETAPRGEVDPRDWAGYALVAVALVLGFRYFSKR